MQTNVYYRAAYMASKIINWPFYKHTFIDHVVGILPIQEDEDHRQVEEQRQRHQYPGCHLPGVSPLGLFFMFSVIIVVLIVIGRHFVTD